MDTFGKWGGMAPLIPPGSAATAIYLKSMYVPPFTRCPVYLRSTCDLGTCMF